MFTKQVEIVDISAPSIVNTGKKPYSVIEVAFREDGKIGGKKLLSFNNEQVFKDIQKYKRGDTITVNTEKDEKGYWQWISISGGESAPAAAQKASVPSGTGRVTGSNYETAEERKEKQRYIVRQSSITAALNFAELTKMAKPSVQGIIGIAQEFEAYVFSKDPVKELAEEMEDDIPL